jgi:hypothetical protein
MIPWLGLLERLAPQFVIDRLVLGLLGGPVPPARERPSGPRSERG